MSEAILSRTQFEQVSILESVVRVEPNQPDSGSEVSAELLLNVQTNPMTLAGNKAGRHWTKSLTLHVEVTLRDGRNNSVELMRARVVIRGGAMFPDDGTISFDELDRHLSANLISMLYGSTRTYLEMLTSMSPVQRFTLPAIDPYSVIELRSN